MQWDLKGSLCDLGGENRGNDEEVSVVGYFSKINRRQKEARRTDPEVEKWDAHIYTHGSNALGGDAPRRSREKATYEGAAVSASQPQKQNPEQSETISSLG